jgi:hypothetical protein
MFDAMHLPNVMNGADVQIFRAPGQWQTWVKPRGKSMVSILAIGSGAGGGGGFSGASGTARGGGGGGGSGGVTRVQMPILALPDLLFCFVGAGGAGGNAGTAGSAGQSSLVSVAPNQTGAHNNIVFASWAVAGGGGAGTASSAGTAGAAATVAPSQYALTTLGSWQSSAGHIGAVGGAQTGAVGASITPSSTLQFIAFGGTGGGGTTSANFAGGTFNGNAWLPTNAGGIADGGKGGDGFEVKPNGLCVPMPIVSVPGTGGGSSNTSVGGAGGFGGIGSGGGGGGGGTTGGRGGNGGHGLVMIVSW